MHPEQGSQPIKMNPTQKQNYNLLKTIIALKNCHSFAIGCFRHVLIKILMTIQIKQKDNLFQIKQSGSFR